MSPLWNTRTFLHPGSASASQHEAPHIPSHAHPIPAQVSQPTPESTSREQQSESPMTHPTPLQRAQARWRQLFSTPATTAFPSSDRPITLSNRNSRTNEPWGDRLQDKSADVTRIYVTNLNGLPLDARGGKFDTVCRALREIQADIFCAQEHNVDTTQVHLRTIIFDTAKQHFTRHRIVLGTTPLPFKTPYKPGGTLVLTTESLTGRICKQIRDKWGRWTGMEYMCQGGQKLVILSAYQPIVKGGTAGKITVAAQHTSLLTAANDKTLNPRVAFRRDLTSCLAVYYQQQYRILLVGDFNEALGADSDGMVKIATRFELLDVMAVRCSSVPPATYARGTHRLDYALASASVCHALQLSGYEAFNSRIASDHRGYFMDFKTTSLFGSETQTLATKTPRTLSSINHTQITAYIRKKYELLDRCHAFDRAQKLCDPGIRHQFSERLDNDVTKASISAEKALPRFGEPAWSKELVTARQQVTILTKYLSYMKTHRVIDDVTKQQWSAQLHPTFFPNTKIECSKLLREAKQRVKEIVHDSFQRRDDELAQKLNALEQSADAVDRVTARRLRHLKKAEDIKNLFKKLKYVRTKTERRGVTRLEVPRDPTVDPKKCNDWKVIDVPTEILELLQVRNRAHFGQSHGSPFTIEPLSLHLGFDGDTPQGRQILQGTYTSSNSNENVQLLLRYLQQLHSITELECHPTITEDEYREKLKIWTEATTTSPSGLHLGHYKALIARHSFMADVDDDDMTPDYKAQRDELNFKQNALLQLHLNMINYALRTGHSYQRWHTIANTILFKDPDNVRLHRTRVIHIYEADYNLALGIKWRSAMHYAEDHDLLNDGQYGSRPKRCAHDPVLIEELQCEISRATRKPMVLVNYDATACYDRIIPNLGMLASQKYGVPPTVTKMNAGTLNRAEYKVRTELGLAPTGYSHEPDFPIYGTGQGSANSPAIWCFLSSTLFDCYDQVVNPAIYASPTLDTVIALGMVGFVDDCNGQSNLFAEDGSQETVDKIIANTTANAQHWNNLLEASGGALELSKCSCHVLQWVFTVSGAPMLVPRHTTLQSKLQVRNNQSNELQDLHLLSAYEAHKTLGHYKAPAGMELEQFRQLKKKSDELTQFLWTCPLSRQEAWTFYYACYLPSVGYPLACSSLSFRQLDEIQRKAMSIMVARCGYNRNTKKEILYGPLELGGANFRHLYIQQGVGQVTTFVKHWRLQSTAGKLLRIALEWFQVQAGVSYSILTHVKHPLPHLESKWINSLRVFLAAYDMYLQIDDVFIPKIQRKYDIHLMDLILDSKKFTPREIRSLNYCRLYLKAITISDLCLVDGITLDPSMLKGTFSPQGSRTKSLTIYQERPSETEWALWRRMCYLLLSDRTGKLFEPLDAWICPHLDRRQKQYAYYEQTTQCYGADTLWIRYQETYVRCTPTDSLWTFRETSHRRKWEELPSTVRPAQVTTIGSLLWKMKYAAAVHIPPPISTPSLFTQYVSPLPPWEAELLQYLEFSHDPFTASHDLMQGIRAVSDGSVWEDNQGAFGWTLSTIDGTRIAQGMGPARGAKVDSYRAEAYGMLAILCLLKHLAIFTHQNVPWDGILATDSQSLLEAITVKPDMISQHALYSKLKDVTDLEVTCPEWDLLSSILLELRRWPAVRLQHVRGHQDRTTDYERLSLLAQLNVDADAMATEFQCEYGASRPVALLTGTAGVHLASPKGTITAHYEAAIRHQATYPSLFKHLRLRNGWSEHTAATINWKAHGTSLRKQLKRKSHYTKLVNGVLPTCRHIHRADHTRNKCPLCKSQVEDWSHILRCPHPDREAWRTSTLEKLKSKCAALKTRPALQRILNDGLVGWFVHPSNDFTLDPEAYPVAVRRVISNQNDIGWHHLFLGRFGTEWSEIQDVHFIRVNQEAQDKKIKRTGQRWQVVLIGFLWDQWWSVWESRNRDLHGADAKSRAAAEARETHRTLHELYDLRLRAEPHVQQLFHGNIAEQLARPVWHTQNWIAINGSVIRDNVRQVTARAKAGMRSIRDYMTARN